MISDRYSIIYGVFCRLSEIGIEVKYMGERTDYFKEGRHVLSLHE